MLSTSRILLIEHINLATASRAISQGFYESTLKCQNKIERDPSLSLHLKAGNDTEIHIPIDKDNKGFFPFPGRIHLAYESTALHNVEDIPLEQQSREIIDPNGNTIVQHLRSNQPVDRSQQQTEESLREVEVVPKEANAAPLDEGHFNQIVGIEQVECFCPKGTAQGIVQFYNEILGTNGRVVKSQVDDLSVGFVPTINGKQHLVFTEKEPFDYIVAGPNAPHIGIYVENVDDCFQRALDRGVAFYNKRNPNTDVKVEFEKDNQFRFKDFIVNGEKVYELEHEVRGIKHKCFPGFVNEDSNM